MSWVVRASTSADVSSFQRKILNTVIFKIGTYYERNKSDLVHIFNIGTNNTKSRSGSKRPPSPPRVKSTVAIFHLAHTTPSASGISNFRSYCVPIGTFCNERTTFTKQLCRRRVSA